MSETSEIRDAVLTDNDRKAALSFAYLAALAAQAGYTCDKGPDPDRDSIDATVRAGGAMRPLIDVQLKATSSIPPSEDGFHYTLKKKNYDDLRAPRFAPIILVVLELPADPKEWLSVEAEQLILRRCARWASLKGFDEIETDSKVVILSNDNRLDVAVVTELMERARRGAL